MKTLVFLTWLSLCLCAQNSLVPFIEICHIGDKKCLLRSSKLAVPWLTAGVPELGINSLDPLHLERVTAVRSGFNMDFRNTTVKGLKNAEILKIEHVRDRLDLVLKCSIAMIGDYTFSGRLLIMPISGDGKYRIRIRDMVLKISIDFPEREFNGNRHWTIKNWSQQYNVETGVDFRFQNLFNGNKQLSDAMHVFANSNWRDIFQETAPPIVDKVISQVIQELGKLFAKVPIKDLIAN